MMHCDHPYHYHDPKQLLSMLLLVYSSCSCSSGHEVAIFECHLRCPVSDLLLPQFVDFSFFFFLTHNLHLMELFKILQSTFKRRTLDLNRLYLHFQIVLNFCFMLLIRIHFNLVQTPCQTPRLQYYAKFVQIFAWDIPPSFTGVGIVEFSVLCVSL